jgi:hypothetical protein
MIRIHLQPEVEAQLNAEAKQQGLALDQYIERLVSGRATGQTKRDSVGEAIDRILELRKGSTLGGLNIKELIQERHKY